MASLLDQSLESVRVDPSIDDASKQVGKHLSQALSSQDTWKLHIGQWHHIYTFSNRHTMQCSNKDSLAWVKPLRGAANEVGV